MPLAEDVSLISVDDHIVEHPLVWTSRLPARYRDAGPHVVELESDIVNASGITVPAGAQAWLYEDRLTALDGRSFAAGREHGAHDYQPPRFDDMRPGFLDARARLADLDLAGIDASLGFPEFSRFAGTRFLEGKDPELALLCVQAYNDFILEEWYGIAPDRFIPLMVVPLWDTAAIAREIDRTAALGARAVTLPETPVSLGLPSYHSAHWKPLWSALAANDLAACIHFGSSGVVPGTTSDAPDAVQSTLVAVNTIKTCTDLLFAGVLQSHPRIRIVLSEGGIGWIPYLLERAEYVWNRHRHYGQVDPDVHPRELFAQSIFGCFIDDEAGLALRHEVGVTNILWEADYPHADSSWPRSRDRATEQFAAIPDAEVRLMAEDNARRVFRFGVEKTASGGHTAVTA